jgi:hypothetical protein
MMLAYRRVQGALREGNGKGHGEESSHITVTSARSEGRLMKIAWKPPRSEHVTYSAISCISICSKHSQWVNPEPWTMIQVPCMDHVQQFCKPPINKTLL